MLGDSPGDTIGLFIIVFKRDPSPGFHRGQDDGIF